MKKFENPMLEAIYFGDIITTSGTTNGSSGQQFEMPEVPLGPNN